MSMEEAPQRLTRKQAAILSAYTGYLVGSFNDMHRYIERLYGRPVFTHEMGQKDFAERTRELAKADLLAICAEGSNV